MIKVAENKIEGTFEFFEDFFKSVDSAVSDKDIVYISVEKGYLNMYSEDKYDGMSSGVSVFLKVPVEGKCSDFSFGVNAEMVVAFFKKLYPGTITIKLKSPKKGLTAEFKEDNIKANFSVVAKRRRTTLPEFSRISGDSCEWIVGGVGDCLAAIAETAKKATSNKFTGILVDTKKGMSRVCKFSNVSFCVKTGPAVFSSDCRFILPDNLAKLCKTFKKTVTSILTAGGLSGIELENGTLVFMPSPHDQYPLEYSEHLSLPESEGLTKVKECYVFEADTVASAVELISSSLGQTDSWINFNVIGQSGGELVWEISGKSHKGVEVSEKVCSSFGPIIEGFMLNKERLTKSLKIFKGNLYVCDLNPSVLALTDEEGFRVSMLVKARL